MKTVLFLINGFGIEQKNSVSIYNSTLMPNLDGLTKEYLFSSAETKYYDINSAYYYFSTEKIKDLTFTFLDTYSSKLNDNPNFKNYLNLINSNNKIHLFIFLNDINSLDHIKGAISSINKNNKIYLHLILTSTDLSDYKEINRMLSKINLEMNNCKIGSIVGFNIFLNDANEYVGLLKSGVGEKWHELEKKMNALEVAKVVPSNVRGFYVNDDFIIGGEDALLFINYQFIKSKLFVDNIKIINTKPIFSMFPMEEINYPLYVYPTSVDCLSNDLKSINAKCLVLCKQNKVGLINYYLNGLKKGNSENILFMATDNLNEETLKRVLIDPQFNLIIIDEEVYESNTIIELNDKLKNIDNNLLIVKNVCLENKYNLLISSLFGMKKELFEDKYTKKVVNFNGKVPVIFVNEEISKVKYKIEHGNISDIKTTSLKLIDSKFVGKALIGKKNFLDNLFKK